MIAISLYLGAIGLGSLVIGAGLLFEGPLALDKRWERRTSNSAYAKKDGDTLDLHADRRLGRLEGASDEVWRPVASVHFFSSGLVVGGALGLGLTAARLSPTAAASAAILGGCVAGYAVSHFLRNLPAA